MWMVKHKGGIFSAFRTQVCLWASNLQTTKYRWLEHQWLWLQMAFFCFVTPKSLLLSLLAAAKFDFRLENMMHVLPFWPVTEKRGLFSGGFSSTFGVREATLNLRWIHTRPNAIIFLMGIHLLCFGDFVVEMTWSCGEQDSFHCGVRGQLYPRLMRRRRTTWPIRFLLITQIGLWCVHFPLHGTVRLAYWACGVVRIKRKLQLVLNHEPHLNKTRPIAPNGLFWTFFWTSSIAPKGIFLAFCTSQIAPKGLFWTF